jgi:two-component system, NtrC family, nitrogen regulation response regulator NtrX
MMMEKPKIIICDDEEGVRESLRLILEMNYEPILTASGEEAIEKLNQHSDIEVVLLDIKMPKSDGLAILKQIKQLRPDIAVIMITGYQTTETAAEAIKLGALDYILKPINSASVLASLRKAI